MADKKVPRVVSTKWRALALLLVGLLAGSLLLGTASAHIGSFQHLKTHFYTKAKANKLFKDKCPPGTTKEAGGCIEKTTRGSANWANANITCADRGRRLPTAGELLAAFQNPKVTPATEITSNIHIDDGSHRMMVVTSASTIGGQVNLDTVASYRCIAPLTNAKP